MLTRAQFLQFLTPFCCARKRLIDCNPCKFTPEAHSRNKELGVCLRRDTSVAARLPLPGVRTLLALPYRTCPSWGHDQKRGHGTVTHRPLQVGAPGRREFLISKKSRSPRARRVTVTVSDSDSGSGFDSELEPVTATKTLLSPSACTGSRLPVPNENERKAKTPKSKESNLNLNPKKPSKDQRLLARAVACRA